MKEISMEYNDLPSQIIKIVKSWTARDIEPCLPSKDTPRRQIVCITQTDAPDTRRTEEIRKIHVTHCIFDGLKWATF